MITIKKKHGSHIATYEFKDQQSADRFLTNCKKTRKKMKIENTSEEEKFLKSMGE